MKKFAVFGNPIAQSLSPTIHQMFAKQCDEVISYEKILAPEDGFVEAAETFLSQEGALGCNVTMPFKLDAYNFARVEDRAAQDAKAVNTLMKAADGEILGFNTDGVGLVNDLINNGTKLAGASVLLIGAGGAARGVIAPLLGAGVSTLTLANRTLEKAQTVAEETAPGKVKVVSLSDIASVKPTVIINSTAASLHGELPCTVSTELFERCDVAYDMVYKAESTVFLTEASKLGAKNTLDGLGMLVEQAAAAFTIWTGKQPGTKEVVVALRELVSAK